MFQCSFQVSLEWTATTAEPPTSAAAAASGFSKVEKKDPMFDLAFFSFDCSQDVQCKPRMEDI